MKLQHAFKLSTLAVALTLVSGAYASTLDVSKLDVIWDNARDSAPASADRERVASGDLKYQYVDVGSDTVEKKGQTTTVTQNQLTELYKMDNEDYFVLKISPIGSPTESEATIYTFDDTALKNDVKAALGKDLKDATATEIADLFKDGGALLTKVAYQFTDLEIAKTQTILPTETLIMAGTTRDFTKVDTATSDIRRLDSKWLEYADSTKVTSTFTSNEGNLTNDDTAASLVLGNVKDKLPINVITSESDRGVITGILDANAVVDNGQVDYQQPITTRKYGVSVHATTKTAVLTGFDPKLPVYNTTNESTVITEKDITIQSKKQTVDANGVALPDTTTEAKTVITANGISTGALTIDGVDVGQTLSNVAQLGTLTSEQLNAVVKSGESISALDTRVTDVEKSVTELDTKLTNEVSRLDGRIDAELTKNAEASTDYTNTTAIKLREEAATESARVDEAISSGDKATLDLAKAEDVKTLDAAKAEDVKTLALANKHTDDSVRDITSNAVSVANEYTNQRVNQLNTRINDVEKTAYRGVAIALAAQQQIPNIGAGQFAVFGGVGHYEGETAGAIGIANVFADGRTSLSAALGVAGGNEVGGRVGVSYVFGGK